MKRRTGTSDKDNYQSSLFYQCLYSLAIMSVESGSGNVLILSAYENNTGILKLDGSYSAVPSGFSGYDLEVRSNGSTQLLSTVRTEKWLFTIHQKDLGPFSRCTFITHTIALAIFYAVAGRGAGVWRACSDSSERHAYVTAAPRMHITTNTSKAGT